MNSSFLQDAWDALRATEYGKNDQLLFTIGFSGIHGIFFWGFNSLLTFLYFFDFFPQWKVQPGKFPPKELIKKAAIDLAISHFLVNPLLTYYVIFHLFQHFGAGHFSPTAPTLVEFLYQIPLIMILEDFQFYWAHRMLHHRSIYKYIHKRHHEFKANIGIAAEYAHPVETFFTVLVPFCICGILVRPHFLVLLVWAIVRTVEAIDAHSGYRFPFSPFQLLDNIQGGAQRHEFHHSHNQGSYGSFFTFWDNLTGTDAPYRAHQLTTTTTTERQSISEKIRHFSLDLSNPTERNIAVKLKENLSLNPRDQWKEVSLDGKVASVADLKDIPRQGRLRLTYVLVGELKRKD